MDSECLSSPGEEKIGGAMEQTFAFFRKRQGEEGLSEKEAYLTAPLLEKTGMVRHLFTTRQGGVSRGEFSTMNLSFTRGDDPQAVLENFRRVTEAMGAAPGDVVCTDQTHTTNIRRVTASDKGKGVTRAKDYRDVDGLITNEPGIVLAVFSADCVPILFADPVRRVIGAVHSGWRGTAGRIGGRMTERMCGEYGCKPEDIRAAIGPSICGDCYEVSEDVAEQFAEGFGAAVRPGRTEGKYQLDLWQANREILLAAGLSQEHIFVTDICTRCNAERLFSHRAFGERRGNMGAFICLGEKGGQNG